ncbi:MAG: methyltransferase [Bacteroidetes bacterium]|nr:MAG: methyltransferase [Bacteroidota bacterium]
MRTAIKNIVGFTYKPFLEKYLSKKRIYTYQNIKLQIPPEVFHPGFFTSTQLLLQYVQKLNLRGKNFLELGAGNGLISIYSAKQEAKVTASDINPIAIDFLKINSLENKTRINIILSDLFENIPLQAFDIIAVNPPYYKKDPQSPLDHAWYCGENGDFFFDLFRQLPRYIHTDSEVYMVLCDGCDLEMIEKAAGQSGFKLICVQIKQSLIEKNFIYKIEKR